MYSWCDVMEMMLHTSVVQLPQTCNSNLIMRKSHKNTNWETFDKIPDQCSQKLSRSSKTKEVWKTHNPDEPKEIWWLNVMWDLRSERRHYGKTEEIQIKYGLWLIIMYNTGLLIMTLMWIVNNKEKRLWDI